MPLHNKEFDTTLPEITIDDYLIENLDPQAFDRPNFYFWVRTVIEALAFVGPETDSDLERLSQLLLDYHSGADIASETVDGINPGSNRLRGASSYKDNSPIGLKYRSLWAIASSRERNIADLYNWQYGIVTAFQTINLGDPKDQLLIALIRKNASKYGANLYEIHNGCGCKALGNS